MQDDLMKIKWKTTSFFFENLRQPQSLDTGRRPQCFEDGRRSHFYINGRQPKQKCKFNKQPSTGNLTNNTSENILAQMKKSTLIGCDIIVN